VTHKINHFKANEGMRRFVADVLICDVLQINEYAEPYQQAKTKVKSTSTNSAFLDSFISTAYPQITQKNY
jgi:hypothetical protein